MPSFEHTPDVMESPMHATRVGDARSVETRRNRVIEGEHTNMKYDKRVPYEFYLIVMIK